MVHRREKQKRSHMFWFGVGLLAFFSAVAIFAPLLSPYNPEELVGAPYLKPCKQFLLGTNDIGQDILSELIYGTRTSLIIGVICSLIITSVGTVLGVMSGLLSSWVDKVISVFINLALSIPSLPLTIVIMAYIGNGIWALIGAMCITSWAGTARIVRSRTFILQELPFIKIERTMGASSVRIMCFHILPNTLDMILVRAALAVGSAMMTEASLSFLGIAGLTKKSWGSILHFAFFRSGVMAGYWWWYLPPILCISLCILAFTMIGYAKEHASGIKNAGENKI